MDRITFQACNEVIDTLLQLTHTMIPTKLVLGCILIVIHDLQYQTPDDPPMRNILYRLEINS